MKYLDKPLLSKIIRRITDDINFIRIDNKPKYNKLFIKTWLHDFRKLDEPQLEDLITSIFIQQSSSIQEACNNNIEYVTIPTLGHLRLNKNRHAILKIINKNGSVTNEEIQNIINSYIEYKNKMKENLDLDINVTLK